MGLREFRCALDFCLETQSDAEFVRVAAASEQLLASIAEPVAYETTRRPR
jgi:hypothetical protein